MKVFKPALIWMSYPEGVHINGMTDCTSLRYDLWNRCKNLLDNYDVNHRLPGDINILNKFKYIEYYNIVNDPQNEPNIKSFVEDDWVKSFMKDVLP